MRESKDEAILALLAKLSLHYWRPDFTPEQAKQLYADYVDDLSPFAFSDIAKAVEKYRQDGANRFFPTVGLLIDLILGKADLEAQNPGAPDRARTLAYARSVALGNGQREMQAMLGELPALPAPARPYRPEPRSLPLASDLPAHPGAQRQPRELPAFVTPETVHVKRAPTEAEKYELAERESSLRTERQKLLADKLPQARDVRE